MSAIQIAVNILSYSVFILSPLYIWFSRRNVMWSTQFGFYITAFVIPLLVIDYGKLYSQDKISLLTMLNATGALFMLYGVVVGVKISRTKLAFSFGFPDTYFVKSDIAERRVFIIILIGCLGMVASFLWMGFLPAMAEDPFLAKFFKGEYKSKYEEIAYFYRFSQFAVITTLPLAIAYSYERRNLSTIIVSLLSMVVLAGSLTRAPVFEGVLLIFAILMSKKRIYFIIFLLLSTFFYISGSAIYYFIGLVSNQVELVQAIAEGAPDIYDNLHFLSKFDSDKDLTYGYTFFGGLIPGNYKFNPAVFSLSILSNDFDIGESASGGFRMPPSTWGLVAFGYLGVVLVCLCSGIFIGAAKKNLKLIEKDESLIAAVSIALWFKVVVFFFSSFYAMYYYGVLSVILFLFVSRRLKFRKWF